MRVPLNAIFNISSSVLIVKQPFRLNGITCHTGLELRRGMSVGGIDFTDWFGRDFEVLIVKATEAPQEIWVIKGIYGEGDE